MLPVLNRPASRRPPAAASTFVPTDLPDLSLWLHAAAGALKFGGAPATADGDLVQAWRDQSPPPSFDFTANSGAEPRLKTGANGINGSPILRFDGVDDLMGDVSDPLSAFITGTAHTIYQVLKAGVAEAASGTIYFLPASLADPGIGFIGLYFHPTAPDVRSYLYDGAERTLIRPYTVGNLYGLEQRHDGGAHYFRRSGLAEISTACGTVGGLTNYFRMGGNPAGNLAMDLAEVLIYKRALSDPERLQVRDYLATKYAFTW